MNLKSILLVEDNPKDIELAIEALDENNLGNDVTVVRDGAEALDYLYRRGAYSNRCEGNPAVVLLDLKMPKVDGIEVLRQIKSDEQMKVVPVVMLTSSREEQDLIKSYQLGVNAYVVKPISFSQVIQAIKQLGLFWVILNEPPPGTRRRSNEHLQQQL
jgi:CheY-like chemotaxis protein